MEVLRLKELLKEKCVSGKELAEKVNVTPASISNIVQGNSFPKPDLLLQIAETLDVDVRDLFNPTKNTDKEFELYFKTASNEFVPFGKLKLKQ
ncbi:MAG: helix-turn-helix transcriptional regulator [Winogradskyella sp.]|nr:helix-turn-helix transcriptional regulator [Winogradskyella sp.]